MDIDLLNWPEQLLFQLNRRIREAEVIAFSPCFVTPNGHLWGDACLHFCPSGMEVVGTGGTFSFHYDLHLLADQYLSSRTGSECLVALFTELFVYGSAAFISKLGDRPCPW